MSKSNIFTDNGTKLRTILIESKLAKLKGKKIKLYCCRCQARNLITVKTNKKEEVVQLYLRITFVISRIQST